MKLDRNKILADYEKHKFFGIPDPLIPMMHSICDEIERVSEVLVKCPNPESINREWEDGECFRIKTEKRKIIKVTPKGFVTVLKDGSIGTYGYSIKNLMSNYVNPILISEKEFYEE